MANQKLIDEVGKYIEKYYEEPEGKVQAAECQIDACDPDEFDVSTMKKEKVKKGMSSTMASNRINAYNEQWDMPKKISGGEFRAFYRGQSDAIWEIEPSIVRSDINERDQYLKYQSKLQGKSLFDQLAYLQHYETGTRLIDFTTDPKVALYLQKLSKSC